MKFIWNRLWIWVRNILIFFFVSSILAVIAFKWVPVYRTPLMYIRCCEQYIAGKNPQIKHQWVDMNKISKHMPAAVISSEDAHFMEHNGFDEKAILQARLEALEGGKERGASSISQQTAKNVFLWQGHSWVRKGLEAYFTFLIEKIWGKKRIMEVYLNSIEMGDGIYGVQACANANFDKDASELTQSDAALIAATLPNPLKFDSANPSKYMEKRRKDIIAGMNYLRNTGNDPDWGTDPAGVKPAAVPQEKKKNKNRKKR
ncbi:MAG: monofunctional biosynthetic peptidoglycan transglycosylase [Muribaculaceae bacterium]|nr:monofunctional biosynthetic peptidoglycan transglycosylase [Muribaculaceae bacterium]